MSSDSFQYRWHEEILNVQALNPVYLKTAMMLWDYSNLDGGSIRPGHDLLAERLGVDVRTVRRHIKYLIDNEFIRLVSKGSGNRRGGHAYAAVYALHWGDKAQALADKHRTAKVSSVSDQTPDTQSVRSLPVDNSQTPDTSRQTPDKSAPNTGHPECPPITQGITHLQQEKSPHASRADSKQHQLTPMQKACDRVAKATGDGIQYPQAKKIFEGIQEDFATPEQMADTAIALYKAGKPVQRVTIIKAIDPTVGVGEWNAPTDTEEILEEAPEPAQEEQQATGSESQAHDFMEFLIDELNASNREAVLLISWMSTREWTEQQVIQELEQGLTVQQVIAKLKEKPVDSLAS